jgi:hypothetical protein
VGLIPGSSWYSNGSSSTGVLAHVVTLCVAEADIGAICESGDKMIEEECAKVYKNPEKDAEGKKVAVAKGTQSRNYCCSTYLLIQ